MLAKDKVIDTVNDLPAQFSLDQLIDRLVFVEKIEKGIEQSDNEEVVSHAEAKQELSKWLK